MTFGTQARKRFVNDAKRLDFRPGPKVSGNVNGRFLTGSDLEGSQKRDRERNAGADGSATWFSRKMEYQNRKERP